MDRRIFISHHHSRRLDAEELCTLLERLGHPCWMAPRDIRPGRDWAGAILEGIDGSSVLVVLESPEASDSGHMGREISCAAAAGKRILRVVLPGCPPGDGPIAPGVPPGCPLLVCRETVADCLTDLLRLVSQPARLKHRSMGLLLAPAALLAAAILLFGPRDRVPGWPESLRFVEIPPGSFLMGSPDDEAFRWQGEGPRIAVTVEGFELMATEVTAEMWTRVMGTTQEELARAAGEDLDAYRPRQGREALPVVMVTWSDAMAFAAALGRLDTLHAYRLPTEAEWEYACRAGGTDSYCGESDGLTLDEISWHFGNSGILLHPAGALAPNAWGLYDMLGNASEWCLDSWREDHAGSPELASDTVPGRRGFRTQRGSCFPSSGRLHRSAFRAMARDDLTYHALGFRVARFPR